MNQNLQAFLSGIGGVMIGFGLFSLWLRGILSELRELKRDFKHLETDQLAKMEVRMDRLESGCVGKTVLERLDNLLGWTQRLDSKIERFTEETAEQRAQIKGDRSYLENVDRVFREHRENLEIHARG